MQNAIPVSAKPFFQEYTFSKLDPREHASLIIERILAYGNRAEVRWVFDFYGVSQLQKWVSEDGSRLLPKRRYYLWCMVLDLAPETIQKKSQWAH
jgi:hypothetical protein